MDKFDDSSSDESNFEPTTIESFWGCSLTKKNSTYTWTAEDDDLTTSLELRQACLGLAAKPNERNIVQVKTEDKDGKMFEMPVLSMTVGVCEQSQLLLSLKQPVEFKLVSGTGPVHISGCVVEEFIDEDEEDDEDEEEEELSEDEKDLTKAIESKKRSAPSPNGKPTKMPKLAKKQKPDDDDDDSAGEKERDSEEGSSEGEEGVDGDVMMGDDDADLEDESDEEEEEEEEKPKKLMKKQAKGPKPSEKTRTPLATPKVKGGKDLAKRTPIDKKKTPKTTLSLEDMKSKLLKTPSIPKKFDKFKNYVANCFKVKEEAVVKQLWEFAQKSVKT